MGVGLRGNSARCFTARNAAAAAHPFPLLRFAPAAFNEYTGCAWCGALYTLVCLQDHRWEDVGYTEVDCRTVKVAVLDKAVLKTNDNETRLLQPFALQRVKASSVGCRIIKSSKPMTKIYFFVPGAVVSKVKGVWESL